MFYKSIAVSQVEQSKPPRFNECGGFVPSGEFIMVKLQRVVRDTYG